MLNFIYLIISIVILGGNYLKKNIILLILIFLIIPAVQINATKINYEFEYSNLPSFFSWKDIDGVDYTTPIKDQSPAPTCEAYALVASLETLMQYQMGELYSPDLSECHLYFYPGGTIEQGYVNLIDAADYLVEYGVPDEGCFPDPHRNFDYPFESLEGWENRTVKIQDWGWVNKDVESIKSALINYGPLIMCFHFPQDFYYYSGGVYEYTGGNWVGGHVVAIVGYDDSNNCWIVKNSWGSNWGEDGWFRLSYDSNLFSEWYGPGTGVMYIDGIYGNLNPDVPKIKITSPFIKHTYLFGIPFSTLFKKLDIQKAAPRLFGKMTLKMKAENTDFVEFYIDGELVHTDDEEPFNMMLKTTPGLHIVETFAYKGVNISKDIVDVYNFI
jgi:hypothetical protein